MTTNAPTAKLAVLLHADVVGSTGLVQHDERLAHQRLLAAFRRLSATIGAYGGVTRELRGDALVAEFSRASDAVAAALAFQTENTAHNRVLSDGVRPDLRIGIALGEVVVADRTVTGAGVVLAQRLEQLASPGGVCVTAAVREALPARLPLDYRFLGEQPVKGFHEPVRAYAVVLRPRATLPDPDIRPSRARLLLAAARRRWLAGAVVLVALAGAGALGVLVRPGDGTGEPVGPSEQPIDRPLIAVLPLENLSGSADDDYVSDGLTQDLIDALGRSRSVAVMSFGAVLPFKGTATNPIVVGRDLGISYLLEGSVRRVGNRFRVAARLTDARNGVLLWSQRFEDENADLLAVQDAITVAIAGRLASTLTGVEQTRAFAKPTSNLDAYDLVLRARAELARASRSSNRKARRLLERALELDPEYAAAHAWLGYAHYLTATDGWTEFPERALNRAEELAGRALSLDPELLEAHRTLSRVYAIRFEVARATAEIERAIEINPSDAEAHGDRGVILLWAGRVEEAVSSLETALTFNPNLRADYFWALGLAYYLRRRHEDAVRILERGALQYPGYVFIRVALVAAYGQLGQEQAARRNVREVRNLVPTFDPTNFGSRFRDPQLYDYLVDGLQKGGLM